MCKITTKNWNMQIFFQKIAPRIRKIGIIDNNKKKYAEAYTNQKKAVPLQTQNKNE